MAFFELVLLLLLGGAALAALARRIRLPYPALLAVAGGALALIPGTPEVTLDPELALALFVAPVLLDAAFDSSPRDMKRQWRSVAGLAIGAVLATIAAVAVVTRLLVPEMPWAAAIALGAIVAPPDAAAATAVLRQLRPPHRLLVVLEGESLFNDATALLVFRLAVGAAITGVVPGWGAIPELLLAATGSVVLAYLYSRLILWVNPRITDVATTVIVQFMGVFALWILAERLHLSAILTMVVFAILVARRAPQMIPARLRIPSYAVWEVTVFVLNVLAFILVGLQLKSILGRLGDERLIAYLGIAAAVTVTAVTVRILFVMRTGLFRPVEDRRERVAIAWCGMRGIVTVAAALALPTEPGGGFPYRDLILFASFCVVVGTLVVQGLTLPPLMRALGLEDDGEVEREVQLAREETARAALDALAMAPVAPELTAPLRHRYVARLPGGNGEHAAEGADAADSVAALGNAMRAAVVAERRRLSKLRDDGTIGDDAFHRVEEELDWAELNVDGLQRQI
jgi:CPA1 family monovalent cation:H+ antiporter